MKQKTLMAIGIVAAFGMPLAAGAAETDPTAIPPSFSAIDTNNDGLISRSEWGTYSRSAAAQSSDSSSSGGSSGNAATTDHTPASDPTGTTAGPGSVSPRTGPGAATATQPSTSGHGKAK